MCTVLLTPGVNSTAGNKYINIKLSFYSLKAAVLTGRHGSDTSDTERTATEMVYNEGSSREGQREMWGRGCFVLRMLSVAKIIPGC